MQAKNPHVRSSLPSAPVARLTGHDGPVQALCFTEDGKYAVTGGHDRSVILWNPSRLDPAFPPSNVDFPKNRSVPLDAIPRALPIQSYSDGFTHPISAIALDKKSEVLVAASEKTLVVTDMISQRVKRRFQGHVGRINSVAVSDGAETYLSASYDSTLRIWDGRAVNSYEPIQTFAEAKDSITDVQIDQNAGNAIIRTAAVDGSVRSYDLRQGQIRCDTVGSEITGMAPTKDGTCVAVTCLDGAIRLIDLKSGDLVNTYKSHKAGQYSLNCCLNGDDSTIVSGSEDGRVVLYDLVKAETVQELRGHTKPTLVAACPNNSSVVISAAFDGNTVVWADDTSYMRWE